MNRQSYRRPNSAQNLPYRTQQHRGKFGETSNSPKTQTNQPQHRTNACHAFGSIGHYKRDCLQTRPGSSRPAVQTGTSFTQSSQIAAVQSNRSQQQAQPKNKERRVNLCTHTPSGQLNHSGSNYPFHFDSGAECSLIIRTLFHKFQGKIVIESVSLKGLGDGVVVS